MPDLRQRVFGRIAIMSPEGTCVGIDLSLLLQRLLLFETVILESTRLLEVPHLIRCFGYDGLIALLKSGAFRIQCDAVALSQAGTAKVQKREGKIISVAPFDFGIVRIADHDQFLAKAITAYRVQSDLTAGKAKKLENHIRGRLIPWSPDARTHALNQTKIDIANQLPPVRRSIALSIQAVTGKPAVEGYMLNISQMARGAYAVETDIPTLCGISDEDAAKALSKGLLGVGGLNSLIDDMRTHIALTGVQQDELPVFDEKLDFLAAQLDPGAQSARLSRVLELTGLPDIRYEDIAETVNIERLLEIRESPEGRAFRQWLWSSDDVTDQEISNRFSSFRTKLSLFVRSGPGKTIRWATSTIAGVMPGLGTVIGGGIGLIDTFLTERILKDPGPLSFLSRKYPSIFERK